MPYSMNLTFLSILFLLLQIAIAARTFSSKTGETHASLSGAQPNPQWKSAKTHLNTSQLANPPQSIASPHVNRRKRQSVAPEPSSNSGGYYLFPISIGTPEQHFNVLFATGASDFWTWGWEMWLDNGYTETAHDYYNAPDSSTSSQIDGDTYGAYYSSGWVTGDVGLDTVVLDSIGVSGNPVPWIQQEDASLFDVPLADGLLGLGRGYYDYESPTPQQNFFNFLAGYLSPLGGFTTSFIDGGAGTVNFGWIDDTAYTGDISYAPCVSLGDSELDDEFWTFEWSGFSIGSGSQNTTIWTVLIDTSTTWVQFPQSIVNDWFNAISGSQLDSGGYWVYPCDTTTFPDLNFWVGDLQLTIPGGILTGAYPSDISGYCWAQPILYPQPEDDYILLGLPLYQSLFIVHDLENNQIGFANRDDTGY